MSNSNDTNAVVTLKYILAQVKHSLHIDDKYDEWFLQEIINVITDINIFHVKLNGVKSITLPISEINTVDLPLDYVDYARIGFVQPNGRIYSLSLNDNIPIPDTQVCAVDTNDYKDMVVYTSDNQLYGEGGGHNFAYYKIDKRNRRIILSGTVPLDKVFLEYISTGVATSETTYIPRQAVSTIVAGVIYHYIDNDVRVPMNEKVRKGDIYAQHIKRLNAFENAFSIDEMMDAIRQGYRQTIKV